MDTKEEEKELIISQSNALTNSRQNFTVIEKRCLYRIICEVRRKYVEVPKNAQGKPKYENLTIQLKPQELNPLADRPREAYAALRKLRRREIDIYTEKGWSLTSWILEADHYYEDNYYEILVSKKIMPYLVELAKEFTSYNLTVAIALKSAYSQRLYELCNQYKNRTNHAFFKTVEELRDIFQIGDKYPNGSDFKKRVLEVAKKELKELFEAGQCDLWFDYAPKDKEGRKIVSYYFFIHLKSDKTNCIEDYQSVDTAVKRAIEIIKPFFPRDKKYTTRVIKEMQLRPEIAEDVTYKLEQKILDYDKASIPPIIRFVLKEDYGIE